MLGRSNTAEADIVVAIVGVVVVAVIGAEVVGIVVVPRPAADTPFFDQPPFPVWKTTSSSTSFRSCIVFA